MLDAIHPNILALIAACFIGSARTLYRVSVVRLSPIVMNVWMLAVQMCFGTTLYLLEGGVANWPLGGLLWFAAMGVSGSLLGRYFSLVGMKLVGLARSSIVTQTSLVWASLFAVVFAGEQMTWLIALGTLTIMTGSILLVYERGEVQRPIPLHYYLAPLGTAVLFAMTHVFGKFGLQIIKSASLGMTAGSMTAFCLALLVLPLSMEGRTPKSWDKKGLLAVLGGACLNAAAAFFFWSSIKTGEIVQIIPLNRLSVLLIIFLSWLFFRKQEAVNLRVVIGGVLSVIGATGVVFGK